jgi:hypothetical protein
MTAARSETYVHVCRLFFGQLVVYNGVSITQCRGRMGVSLQKEIPPPPSRSGNHSGRPRYVSRLARCAETEEEGHSDVVAQ